MPKAKAKPTAISTRAGLANDVLWVAHSLGLHTMEKPQKVHEAPTPTAWSWYCAIRDDKSGQLKRDFFGRTLPSMIPKMTKLDEEDQGVRGEEFKIEEMGELRRNVAGMRDALK